VFKKAEFLRIGNSAFLCRNLDVSLLRVVTASLVLPLLSILAGVIAKILYGYFSIVVTEVAWHPFHTIVVVSLTVIMITVVIEYLYMPSHEIDTLLFLENFLKPRFFCVFFFCCCNL
jgi:hypothetical protein